MPNSENVRCLSLVPTLDLTSRDLTLKQVRSFQEVLPFSCLISFSWHDRVLELDVSLVVHPLRWFFCLLGCESLYSLFLCALVYLWLVEFRQVGIRCFLFLPPQNLTFKDLTLKPLGISIRCFLQRNFTSTKLSRCKWTYPPINSEFQLLEAMRSSFFASKSSLTYTLIGSWCMSMLNTFLITFLELLF